MKLDDIKNAVDEGIIVCWKSDGYRVVKQQNGEYNIVCQHNGHTIGLTWTDEQTMNGKEEDFFMVFKNKGKR